MPDRQSVKPRNRVADAGRKDGGKDALLNHPTFGPVVFHFSLRSDWATKLEEDLERVHSSRLACKHFVFFTNRKAAAAQKDRLKQMCRQRFGWQLEVYDQERLRVVLDAEKQLRAQYFPEHYLVTEVVGQLSAVLERLVSSGLAVPRVTDFQQSPQSLLRVVAETCALAKENRIEDVLSSVSEIVKVGNVINRDLASGLWSIGCLCFERGHYGETESIWRKAVSFFPDHYGLNLDLAILMEYDNRGRRYGCGFRDADAVEYYHRALESSSSPSEEADCLDNEGVVLLKIGRIADAKKCFEEAQRRCPEHLSSRANLASVAATWELQETLSQPLLGTPLEDHARINMAATLIEGARFDDALPWLRGVRSLRNSVQFRLSAARIAMNRHRLRAATRYARTALKQDPDNSHVHLLLGDIFSAKGNLLGAVAAYESALNLHPCWYKPHLRLADTLYKLRPKDWFQRVTTCLQTALQISPDLRNVHNQLGLAYLDEKMYASARVEFERELSLHPDNELPLFNLGYLADLGRKGVQYGPGSDLAKAIGYYRQSLHYNPDFFPALFNLGTDLSLSGHYAEAISIFENAMAKTPNNDSLLCNLGVAYSKTGRTSDALACWSQALKLNPDNVYAKANMATHVLDRREFPVREETCPAQRPASQ